MTTAEIMFAQPGDGTIDREHDARKVLWALLAALFIHLVVAYSLAVFGGVFSPALPVEEKPVQLTFVDLPTAPLVPKNSAFIETDESKQSAEPPKEKTFESNAWQGSPVRRFRNTSLLASNEWGATAAQCGATRKSKAFGSATADSATASDYRSGAICDVDRKTNSADSALCCPNAGASAIRLSALKRSNAHLRQHHKPRPPLG